ncbi:hypothetical protein JKF63_03604 [Porcisia hertigi]|uniref:RNA-editing substrate-binding complex 7 protein domain-containing protein n=1 Tax=Porcisia hertigi TaxID=2761500 RepID=A0A836L9S0_9TRYP|nr:hypothetical protein JKF63_03604 [Porcisia hertigi]
MIRKLTTSLSASGPAYRPTCLHSYPRSVGYGWLGCVSLNMEAGADAFVGRTAAACSIINARRFYFTFSRVCMHDASNAAGQPPPPPQQQQQQAPIPSVASSGSTTSSMGTESALDVAMRVNKMKKAHQSGGAGANKKGVEEEAWRALNSLTEDQINNAEGKAVSLLLNAWAYFAKFWAKGKDGPL